ncbi:hypothetical protein ACHQM5_008008 [Ranunculus cassubicifolius]
MVLIVFVGVDYEGTKAKVFNNQVQVHTLGSTSWRIKHEIVPNVLRKSRQVVSPAFINSCLHWLTFDGGLVIVSFHMGLEEFGLVPTPDSRVLKRPQRDYKLGLLGECLSLVECSPNNVSIDIWVMKRYNVKESWVNQFSIERPECRTAKLIKFRKNCELLLLLDDVYMVGINTRNQKRRVLPLGWQGKRKSYKIKAYPLVGSLLRLKSAFGMANDTKESTSADVNK